MLSSYFSRISVLALLASAGTDAALAAPGAAPGAPPGNLDITFDVDVGEREKQLSLGMRVVSTLGAVALAASAFYFFYRIWGLISFQTQVAILAGARWRDCCSPRSYPLAIGPVTSPRWPPRRPGR